MLRVEANGSLSGIETATAPTMVGLASVVMHEMRSMNAGMGHRRQKYEGNAKRHDDDHDSEFP